ncbi:uncharacterized protein EI90DRAFT_642729 [Cantharellus anzutake]|uniref:uncharacterized protein n=1 Tax=Cantharellus anzutake TaxID=1750568 RepID=UPI001906FEB4|nr:uncharacterized protein EI90DRAFT_642729 [Cantharellus anzutake]KAF8333227.1 hypothetical protein EI90DRAFT_642729 [Cantharellus anzutake]
MPIVSCRSRQGSEPRQLARCILISFPASTLTSCARYFTRCKQPRLTLACSATFHLCQGLTRPGSLQTTGPTRSFADTHFFSTDDSSDSEASLLPSFLSPCTSARRNAFSLKEGQINGMTTTKGLLVPLGIPSADFHAERSQSVRNVAPRACSIPSPQSGKISASLNNAYHWAIAATTDKSRQGGSSWNREIVCSWSMSVSLMIPLPELPCCASHND